MRRFFLTADKKMSENEVLIDGSEYVHLNKVLRIGEGEKVVISFGDGNEHEATILKSFKDHAVAQITKTTKCLANPQKNLCVYQAMLKGDKLELVVQKLSEIGAKRLVVFHSKFTNAKIDDKKVERLCKIAQSASKQCGRSDVLEIEVKKSLCDILPMLDKSEITIFAYEKEAFNTLSSVDLCNISDCAIVVGSEGGFDEQESQMICRQKNVFVTSLGKRILRAETASIVLSAIAMHKMGEI